MVSFFPVVNQRLFSRQDLLFQNLFEPADEGRLELQNFLDVLFQGRAVIRVDVEVGSLASAKKSGSFIVSMNALRRISTRSCGLLGGNT